MYLRDIKVKFVELNTDSLAKYLHERSEKIRCEMIDAKMNAALENVTYSQVYSWIQIRVKHEILSSEIKQSISKSNVDVTQKE